MLKIFDAIVKRIIAEMPNKKKCKAIINKGWNILKTVVKSNHYMPLLYDQIEGLLKPLFEFIVDPDADF